MPGCCLVTVGLRFINATTSDTTSLSINARYPVTTDFRVNQRFRADFRKNHSDGSGQFICRPSAWITWHAKRRFRLEAELGGEWSDREIVTGSTRSRSYFVNPGTGRISRAGSLYILDEKHIDGTRCS